MAVSFAFEPLTLPLRPSTRPSERLQRNHYFHPGPLSRPAIPIPPSPLFPDLPSHVLTSRARSASPLPHHPIVALDSCVPHPACRTFQTPLHPSGIPPRRLIGRYAQSLFSISLRFYTLCRDAYSRGFTRYPTFCSERTASGLTPPCNPCSSPCLLSNTLTLQSSNPHNSLIPEHTFLSPPQVRLFSIEAFKPCARDYLAEPSDSLLSAASTPPPLPLPPRALLP